MAYKWVQNKQCYVGLHTDLKPIKVDIGAKLHEFNLNDDIMKTYQTPDGGTTWIETGNDSIGSVSLEAGNEIVGKVKLTDGTDALIINTNGSINIIPINSLGSELFTPATPGVVQLSGSYVEIGGVSFAVSGGDTLRNTAANKPDAAAAHAVIPFCYYHAIDTGAIEATDGTNWVVI